MTRTYLAFVCTIAFSAFCEHAQAQEPKKNAVDPIEALIDQLQDVSEPDYGYSGTTTGGAFLPLGQREFSAGLLGGRPHVSSNAMRELVKQGVKAIPKLLERLDDNRTTKIELSHRGGFGGLFIEKDAGEKAEEGEGDGFSGKARYKVRVGDLCYVALGQIVNRNYWAVRYQPTAIIIANCVPKLKKLREELKKEWGGLTEAKHKESLNQDLDSLTDSRREGASLRFAYFYPEAFEPLAIKQLLLPTYDGGEVGDFIREGQRNKLAIKERKAALDAFVKKNGAVARDGLILELFEELATEERLKEFGKENDFAKRWLVDLFGYPETVKSSDVPKLTAISERLQNRFLLTLAFDQSEKLDKVVLELLKKTDNGNIAKGCLNRLVGRGYDIDIEEFFKRQESGKFKDPLNKDDYTPKLGWTRLHKAIELNIPEMIEDAISKKLDVNARSKTGETALHLAARDGKLNATERLLKAKADPNLLDNKTRYPVEVASFHQFDTVVRLLVANNSHVPDILTATIIGDEVRLGELLKGDKTLVKKRNDWGYGPLHVAVIQGHEKLILQLLEAGADINDIDESDKEPKPNAPFTPLILAIAWEKNKIAKLLIEKGADVNIPSRRKDTALHFAVKDQNIELVKLLLANKANPRAKDEQKLTPIDHAEGRKNKEILELLKKAK